MNKTYRFAIVHDWLPLIGGAEKVLAYIHQLYPGPIYTLIQHPENLRSSYFKDKKIVSSFIQKLPFAKNKYRNYLPLFPFAIEQFDLREYDVVISSSYAVAKGVITNSNQMHICYCHSPVRYAWDLYHQYLEESNLQKGVKGLFAKMILHYLRNWDIASVNRVDHFIANSNYIAKRIKKIYRREATVIYPPVEIDRFEFCSKKEDFYMTASRMVPYKRMDLIVEAFAKMPEKRLVVIGDGPDFKKIAAKATANVTIMGHQPFEVLKDYMQRAKAFVFAAEEDFGITPVEAQACGTPVIAFGKGGACETIENYKTGLFFNYQTTDAIIAAVKEFEHLRFDYNVIRQNATRFDTSVFKQKFKEFVDTKCQEL